jgi:two-component system cell cycle sensor histidine kinase/response regulator CckA
VALNPLLFLEHPYGDALTRQLAGLIDQSREAAFVWKLGDTPEAARIVFWNRGAEALYGYARTDALGRAPQALLKTEAPGGFESILEILRHEMEWSGRLTHRTRAGASLTLEARMTVMADGGSRWVLQTNHDITGQLQLLRAVDQNAERFRRLCEGVPAGIMLADRTGAVSYMNHQAERLFARPIEELAGQGWQSGIHPFDRPHFLAVLHEAATTSEILSVEFRIVRPSGEIRFGRGLCQMLPGESGGADSVVFSIGDITERKVAEDALRENEQLLREALRMAQMGTGVRDLRTGVVRWSPELYEVVGLDPATPVDEQTFISLLDQPARERATAALAERLPGQPVLSGDFAITKPDGSVAIVHVEAKFTHDAHGEPNRLLSVVQNVTHRHVLEARIQHATKMEAIAQLAGGVAHDFNNLLMVIVGNLDLLEMARDDAERVAEFATDARNAAERGAALTRQLLTFSRNSPPHPRPIDLKIVLAQSERLLRRALGERNELAVNVADDSAVIVADAGQIEQVLMNLVVNARDAMPHGGAVMIDVASHVVDSQSADRWPTLVPGPYVRLEVSDTGPGMSEDVRRRAFEPFFTTKAPGQGTGLGLATVYGIVSQAGGAIDISTTSPAGTRFTILIPRSAETPEWIGGPAASALARGNACVLLVEDEFAVRMTIRLVLEKNGYTVLEAKHGEDALLVWNSDADLIDVLLTDLRMPQMGGRALAARLRAERPDLPVLFMSGYEGPGLPDDEAADIGAPVLQKPFSSATLLDAIAGRLPTSR